MATRTVPSMTMGSSVVPDAPKKSEEKSEEKKPEKKVSKALKEAAGALCEVLNSAGVLDYKETYGEEFAAFHKAAKSDGPEGGEYEGLTVSMMDEDVEDSVLYNKRIKSRKYWGAKLAAL